MNSFKLTVSHLYDGENIKTNQTVAVDKGVIISIEPAVNAKSVKQGLLIPGFIDVQVNGGGGCLFNHEPTLASLKKIGKAHQKFGTTGWLPTLVTDSFEKMSAAADSIAESITDNLGILGVHFEGPFLSENKKGVHAKEFIRQINDADMQLLTRADLGKVLVTVAPENVSPEQIKELVSEGIIVSIGHSAASYEQAKVALEAGASGFTHLYNAMSPLNSREPGVVGAALTSPNTFSGIILDGLHLHPAAAAIAYHSQTELMLVTDAMPPVGSEQQHFEFFGQQITRQGHQLKDSEGRLAGSTLDMMSAVKNAEQMLSIDFLKAVDLATLNPANFLGLEKKLAKLQPGFAANMLLISETHDISASWIKGYQQF